ncbi:family 10 glycosylhydrolase [Clostridium vincentii]|uniref:family 10 glycosylhydrolase n=1 Tax=Clostridium vincentii TaxID=52704 RepID=UPI001A9A57F5|nr:family 10 glycosylhydrolase [Clostridium vincentii]
MIGHLEVVYPSKYAPWSKYITGTLGSNPGYDPLSFALDYTHQKNMEFHVGFNPFR